MAVDTRPNVLETLLFPFASFLKNWDYRPVTSWF